MCLTDEGTDPPVFCRLSTFPKKTNLYKLMKLDLSCANKKLSIINEKVLLITI